MKPIQPASVKTIRSLPFYKGHLLPIISKVLDSSNCGTAYMGQSRTGTYVFILHQSGFGYIDTDGELDDALQSLQYEIIHGLDLPQYFHIYCFDDINTNKIDRKHFNYKLRQRTRFIHDNIKQAPQVCSADKFILKTSIPSIKVTPPFKEVIKPFWDSLQSFEDNSIACWLCDDNDTPLSLCYAAVIANGIAEVDIYTIESHRGLGLAKITADYFVKRASKMELKISWDCFEDNLASSKLAIESGFKQTNKINFLSLFKIDEIKL